MILPSRDDLLLHRIRKNISTRKKENKQSAIYIYIYIYISKIFVFAKMYPREIFESTKSMKFNLRKIRNNVNAIIMSREGFTST